LYNQGRDNETDQIYTYTIEHLSGHNNNKGEHKNKLRNLMFLTS